MTGDEKGARAGVKAARSPLWRILPELGITPPCRRDAFLRKLERRVTTPMSLPEHDNARDSGYEISRR